MFKDKVTAAAFLVSFTGHCLFLSAPGINFTYPDKAPADIPITLEIEKPTLLPKIDRMGEEKKIMEIKPEIEPPRDEAKVEPSLTETVLPQSFREKIPEPVTADNPDNEELLRYQDMVKQKIEQARVYPAWARKHGMEGTTYLRFSISADGSIKDISLIRPSGKRILDEEALATVKRAAPFPKAPKESNNSSIGMKVAIVFSLNTNHFIDRPANK